MGQGDRLRQSFAVAVRGQTMCFGFSVDAFAWVRVKRELAIACVVAELRKIFSKNFWSWNCLPVKLFVVNRRGSQKDFEKIRSP